MTRHWVPGSPYAPNIYSKTRLVDIKVQLGGCQWPGSYTLFCGDKGEDHHSFWDHEDEHDFKPKSLLQLALERAYTYLLPRHTVIQVVG